MPPAVSTLVAVVPVLDRHEMTRRCVESLRAGTPEGCELKIVLVDDGSREPYAGFPGATVVRHETPRGYTQATNRGVAMALGESWPDAVLLLNNDIEFRPGSLVRLLEALGRFDLAGFWGRVVPQDQRARNADGNFVSDASEHPVPFLEFSCALVRTSVFAEVGLLDARFEQGYYADDDFCLRCLLAGRRLGLITQASPPDVVHHVAGTHGAARVERIRRAFSTFLQKWGANEAEAVQDYIRDYLWDPHLGSFGRLREAVAQGAGLQPSAGGWSVW